MHVLHSLLVEENVPLAGWLKAMLGNNLTHVSVYGHLDAITLEGGLELARLDKGCGPPPI